MPVLKNLELIDDEWLATGDDWQSLPDDAAIIVPFQQLLANWSKLKTRSGKLGVAFSNIERAEALDLFIDHLSLIELPFPSFTDGRSFSLASLLRRKGFTGEIRASGHVLPDQLVFLNQTGFDAVEVDNRFPHQSWIDAAQAISHSYQNNRGPARKAIWGERHKDTDDNIWLEQPHAG